jgi:hypothetical protein
MLLDTVYRVIATYLIKKAGFNYKAARSTNVARMCSACE